MITLHHLHNSRAHRILWLLEELALPYQLIDYPRDARTLQAPAALRAIHPLGKSPVITDEEVVVAESGAIVEYLIGQYGQGRFEPAGQGAESRQYHYWLHYAEGSLMPLLLMQLVFARLVGGTPWPLRPLTRRIARGVNDGYLLPQLSLHLGVIETTLAGQPYLAGGEVSGADVQMCYPLALARGYAVPRVPADYPRIDEYLARLEARPAWQRAVARGGGLLPLH